MTSPRLLTTSEAAERMGVTGETVRRWAEVKRIRHIRLPSGQLRFRAEWLDAAMQPVEPDLDGAA